MAAPKKSEHSPGAFVARAESRSARSDRGGGVLPHITILTSAIEGVESAGRWLQQTGYTLAWLQFESVDWIQVGLHPPEVLLLHTRSPDMDLSRIEETLRQRKSIVIVLTTREGFAGLDFTTGFDDFMYAPYDPREVEARIRFAVWRRHGMHLNNMIIWEDLAIDLDNYEVRVRGESIDLTLKEYELLKYLATRRGRVFTREHLLTEVWGYNYYGGTRTVDVHVRRLRMKLERSGAVYINTVRGVGYKFGE